MDFTLISIYITSTVGVPQTYIHDLREREIDVLKLSCRDLSYPSLCRGVNEPLGTNGEVSHFW